MTDADLVRGAQRGEAEAWRALYARYLPMAWRQAYALVSDVHAAEDVTSEAMLSLLENLSRLETDVASLNGWLRGVVRHKAADHQRKLIRGREMLTLWQSGANGNSTSGPVAPLEMQESRDEVLKALDQLSERERIVLEWKYLDSHSVREIASRLNESEKAVESTLYRARREFRRVYELDSRRSAVACKSAARVDATLQP